MLDLSKPWREVPLVVVDFEATSADPETCEPVEVAAVRFEGGRIVGRFASLLKPSGPIPAEATAIHGITDEMVANAPTLEQVAPELAAIAAGAVPVAYNEPYDRRVLHRYVTGQDVPLFNPAQPWVDVYVIAASPLQDKYVSGKGRLKLTEVCRRHGVVVSDAHRALADAQATGQLMHVLMGEKTPTMQQVLARCGKLRAEQDADYNRWKKQQREAERAVWREYAKEASAGLCARGLNVQPRALAEMARAYADEMLAVEKERWS